MDVTKIIALLRERAMVGRMEVRDKQLMIMAADELERKEKLYYKTVDNFQRLLEVTEKKYKGLLARKEANDVKAFLAGAKERSFIDNYGFELVAIAALEEMFGGENERD